MGYEDESDDGGTNVCHSQCREAEGEGGGRGSRERERWNRIAFVNRKLLN